MFLAKQYISMIAICNNWYQLYINLYLFNSLKDPYKNLYSISRIDFIKRPRLHRRLS